MKQDVRSLAKSITDDDLQKQMEIFTKDPDLLKSELTKIVENMNEKDVEVAVKRVGGPENLMKLLMIVVSYKLILIKRGLQIGAASGVAAALFFGTGAMAHSVAEATSIGCMDDIADGFDCIGDMAADFSDVGFDIARDSADSVLDFIGGIFSAVFS